MKSLAFLFLLAVIRATGAETLVPLDDLGAGQYRGFTGGLYADGKNAPHGAHAEALRQMCAAIQPLDQDGKPSADGKIVVAGIGASVCVQIFTMLEEIGPKADGKRAEVVFVNCAKGGHDVNKISDPARGYWESAIETVKKAGFSPAQVQVAWYQSDDLRDTNADFPARPQRLQESIARNMRELKQHFPNTRLCYHSARHTTAFMPADEGKAKHAEPRPWHVGWSVKWLIEAQSKDAAELKFDGDAAKAPLITWAGYFWTNGDQPRHDGYRWTAEMNVKDGVHLTDAGRTRVAGELLAFWRTDSFAKHWFTAATAATSAPPAAAREKTIAATASTRIFTYQSGGARPLQMLAYLPPGWQPSDQRPALMLFQGGAFSPVPKKANDRAAKEEPRFGKMIQAPAEYFSARGWVCLHTDYRSSQRDGASATDTVSDAFAALRWVRTHAGELGIAPSRIAAGGVSGGGQLASSLAVLADPAGRSAVAPPVALVLHSPLMDFLEGGTRSTPFLAAVDNDRTLAERLSPSRHWRADAPPTLLFSGEREPVFESLRDFAGKWPSIEFIPVSGGHGASLQEKSLATTLPRMEAFLNKISATAAPAAGKPAAPTDHDLKPQVIAAQKLKPGESALLINGKSKFAKLERLLATSDPVRLVAWDLAGKQLLTIDDVFHQRTDLNEKLGSGEFRVHFLDKDGQRLKMTMDVPDVVRLK